MPRPPGTSLRVGISTAAVTLVRAGRFGAPAVLATAPIGEEGSEALDLALSRLLGDSAWRRWPASFVLADELVRMWTVVPPPQAARMADLQAGAAFRFEHLYGEPADGWRIAADWNATGPFMAAAIPQALWAAILRAAALQRLAVTAIEPHFVAAWNAWRGSVPRGAWFLLLHGRVLAVGITQGGRMVGMRPARVPPGAGAEWLDAHVAREALLLAMAPPSILFVCGHVPANWEPRQGWVVAATGAGGVAADVHLALAGVCA